MRISKSKLIKQKLSLVLAGLLTLATCGQSAVADKEELAVNKLKGNFSVIVLGSGGPVATAAGRASAGYLIFIDGTAKILMDAGGGTFQRLAQSGANIKDLDVILLTHLHLDHMAELPAMVKTMYFHNRQAQTPRDRKFKVVGPSTNHVPFPAAVNPDASVPQYPDTSEHVDGQFNVNTGINRYLNVFATAISGGKFGYETQDVSPLWDSYNPETIYDKDGVVIKAVGVNHGPVPALAFRIEYLGKSVVYSGDTSSKGSNMIEFSKGADMLIYDTALLADTAPNDSFNIFYALHSTPGRIGQVADQAGVKKLILSHITPMTEGHDKELKARIREEGYHGAIKMANDLDVYNLQDDD